MCSPTLRTTTRRRCWRPPPDGRGTFPEAWRGRYRTDAPGSWMGSDVQIAPLLLDERVQLVAFEPRLRQHVLDRIVGEDPRRVVEDEIVHFIEDRRPLRPVGKSARLFIQRVEGGQPHVRIVRRADVLAVEIAVEVAAVGDAARPS